MSSVCMHYILLIHSSADGHLTISTVWLMWIVLLQTHLASFCLNSFWVCILPNPGLCAACPARPKKPKCWGLEQRKVYYKGQARRTGISGSENPNSLHGFQGRVFKSNIWNEGYGVYDFLLIGWWSGNRLLLPESQSSVSWFWPVFWGFSL